MHLSVRSMALHGGQTGLGLCADGNHQATAPEDGDPGDGSLATRPSRQPSVALASVSAHAEPTQLRPGPFSLLLGTPVQHALPRELPPNPSQDSGTEATRIAFPSLVSLRLPSPQPRRQQKLSGSTFTPLCQFLGRALSRARAAVRIPLILEWRGMEGGSAGSNSPELLLQGDEQRPSGVSNLAPQPHPRDGLTRNRGGSDWRLLLMDTQQSVKSVPI